VTARTTRARTDTTTENLETTTMSIVTATATGAAPNLDVFRAWVERFNARDFDGLTELVALDVVDHHLPPELPAGRAGAMQWFHMLAAALDLRIVIEDAVENGDRVAVRASITGTHIGDFAGVPATGRAFTTTMISIERIVDGRIVERWENVDNLAVMQQLAATD
jgi:steroid delta-isomerase-like uncharacterized protein